jgi:hypothetical protein
MSGSDEQRPGKETKPRGYPWWAGVLTVLTLAAGAYVITLFLIVLTRWAF